MPQSLEAKRLAFIVKTSIGVFKYEIYALTKCVQPHWWQFLKRRSIKEQVRELRCMLSCYEHMLHELEKDKI